MAFIFQNALTGLIYNLMTYNEFWSVVLLSTLVTLLPDFGFNIRFFSPQSGGVLSGVPEGRVVRADLGAVQLLRGEPGRKGSEGDIEISPRTQTINENWECNYGIAGAFGFGTQSELLDSE